MLIKFPDVEEESTLDILSREIETRTLISDKSLDDFLFQLRKIENTLEDKNYQSDTTSIHEKQKLIKKLTNRCELLKQRNLVINICEDAEELANNSPRLSDSEIKTKVSQIEQRIQNFSQNHRPSKNNMKFLRFAQKILEKAKNHQKVLSFQEKKTSTINIESLSQKEITLEDFSLAEGLYELASLLYEKKIDAFIQYKKINFTAETQKEIFFHMDYCNFDLQNIETAKDLYPAIQGILGYAHTLTDYYTGSSPYPTFDEINDLFASNIY